MIRFNRIQSELIWDIYGGQLIKLLFLKKKKRERNLAQINCKYVSLKRNFEKKEPLLKLIE